MNIYGKELDEHIGDPDITYKLLKDLQVAANLNCLASDTHSLTRAVDFLARSLIAFFNKDMNDPGEKRYVSSNIIVAVIEAMTEDSFKRINES